MRFPAGTCRGLIVAATVAAAFALPAEAQNNDKKTLLVGVQSDLKFLYPITTPSRVTSMFAGLGYETLFNADADGVPRPQMVGDYKVSEDKLTYEFTLRPGLKWHSGGKVTAADAVA